MAIQTTYTQARANLAKLLDEETQNQEVVVISRRKAEDVAMISASELSSILEIHHLLRLPQAFYLLILFLYHDYFDIQILIDCNQKRGCYFLPIWFQRD